MLPRIGINCNVKTGLRENGDGRLLTLSPDFTRCVRDAGGLPLLLPPAAADGRADPDAITSQLDAIDGLVLSGGDDLDPHWYGEDPHHETRLLDAERLASDAALVQAALSREIPILAVCAGMQLVNVALGGTLHQHLADLRDSLYPELMQIHFAQETAETIHRVDLIEGTRLAGIVGPEPLTTNSRHHQAVARIGERLRLSARAEDGIIEALEGEEERFLVCVQWHPEEHLGENRHLQLFRSLIDAARERTFTGGGR